jgi:hypothetical protein
VSELEELSVLAAAVAVDEVMDAGDDGTAVEDKVVVDLRRGQGWVGIVDGASL